jgi:hypothetical protein
VHLGRLCADDDDRQVGQLAYFGQMESPSMPGSIKSRTSKS